LWFPVLSILFIGIVAITDLHGTCPHCLSDGSPLCRLWASAYSLACCFLHHSGFRRCCVSLSLRRQRRPKEDEPVPQPRGHQVASFDSEGTLLH
jgi:hypothetical protein